jgi:hypothetical protein
MPRRGFVAKGRRLSAAQDFSDKLNRRASLKKLRTPLKFVLFGERAVRRQGHVDHDALIAFVNMKQNVPAGLTEKNV